MTVDLQKYTANSQDKQKPKKGEIEHSQFHLSNYLKQVSEITTSLVINNPYTVKELPF
ncbi:hypothetical protein ABC382_20000 [Lysinibacillus sp. 1P01SD]|uniref:hypothetical protein n=1 Tax=Lysinibacillus sp. 1P01SD TaxID=3132285 RepID=UPI00399FCAF1